MVKFMLKLFGKNVLKKAKKRAVNKFLAEIGWREFNHSLINYFPHMLKGKLFKKI